MGDELQPDAANDTASATESAETSPPDVGTPEGSENAAHDESDANADESAENADSFPREYVEKLRKESAGYRAKADEVSRRLHAALVTATGRLADPADLPYAAEHLDSPKALTAAIDSLLEAKPHFKSRIPRGEVGQGVKDSAPTDVSLGAALRSRI